MTLSGFTQGEEILTHTERLVVALEYLNIEIPVINARDEELIFLENALMHIEEASRLLRHRVDVIRTGIESREAMIEFLKEEKQWP